MENFKLEQSSALPRSVPEIEKVVGLLRGDINYIKDVWGERVKKTVPESATKASLALSDSLDIFLEDLLEKFHYAGTNFAQINSGDLFSTKDRTKAIFRDYFLPQLLKEFSILRQILNEVLYRHGLLTHEIRSLVDQSVDAAISHAATDFTTAQQQGLRAALSEAQTSNKDLDQFASVAAHDLKSPLATIRGFVDVLQHDYAKEIDSEGQEYLDTIQGAAERMGSLIDALLDYSRLSAPEKEFEAVDLNEVLKGTLQNLEKVIADTGAAIKFQSLPKVLGDTDFLRQLFQNLIANSIKFRSTKPLEISIETVEDQNMWQFEIKDNGIGFDPKFKTDIFDLYRKLNGADTFQGSGIGLATCRRVVETHGGKIWADSMPGQGANFHFTLPKMAQ